MEEAVFEQYLIYGISAAVCLLLVLYYIKNEKKKSAKISQKVSEAKEEGRFEPVSLYPHIDTDICIGSGACVKACPEKDILGIVDGKATVINAANCIGHGACFHACPVEAISLRIGTEKRGVDLPHIKPSYETNVPGIYIAGELGGMGLIKNSTEQGIQAVENAVKKKKPDLDGIFDLIIVGAGPAGIAGGLTAKKHGLKFKILDQDSLGGTVFSYPREKVVMTHPMELPLHGKIKLYDTSKEELLNIWKSILAKNNIEVEENTKVEKIVAERNGIFKVSVAGGKEFETQQVLIAIGRRGSPRKLNVPGEELPKVFYRLLEPEQIEGKDILVVGGGDSAVETAMLLMEKNRVTLSYRSDKFARIKPKNKELIDLAIEKNKLSVEFNSTVKNIELDTVLLSTVDHPEGKLIPNHVVYVFAGGELPIDFLKNAGIEVEKKFGKVVKSYKNS